MSIIKQLLLLKEDSALANKINRQTFWGWSTFNENGDCPQYAEDEQSGRALNDLGPKLDLADMFDGDDEAASTLRARLLRTNKNVKRFCKVKLHVKNPATYDDLVQAAVDAFGFENADDKGLNDIWDQYAEAQLVSVSELVRNQLKKKGFDSWAGDSILYNTITFQVVPFYPSQVQPVIEESVQDQNPSYNVILGAISTAMDHAVEMEEHDPKFSFYREDGYTTKIVHVYRAPHLWNDATKEFAIPVCTKYENTEQSDKFTSDIWYIVVNTEQDKVSNTLSKAPWTWESTPEYRRLKMMNDLHDDEVVNDQMARAKSEFEQKHGIWRQIKA